MVLLVSLHAFPWQHWLAKWKVSLADTWTVKVSATLQLSAEQALSSYHVMFPPREKFVKKVVQLILAFAGHSTAFPSTQGSVNELHCTQLKDSTAATVSMTMIPAKRKPFMVLDVCR